jgi:hypothetical protein
LGTPWPIAIVGTTDNPMNNHQILAYGYEDYGNGKGLIYVYDDAASPANVENTIAVDFTGNELVTVESAYGNTGGFEPQRGPLKGIFCSEYFPDTPPIALGLEQGLTASPPGFVDPTKPVQLQFTAKEYGYGPTSPLRLDVKGIDFAQPPNLYDVGQEQNQLAIQSGSDRSYAGSVTLGPTASWSRYFAAAHLGVIDGVDVWKNIPGKEIGTSVFVELAAYAAVLGGIWNINANGFLGTLNVQSVDPAGRLSGTIFNNPMIGFWNEPSRCLTIIRIPAPGDPSQMQIYSGYLIQNQGAQSFSLAGSFDAFAGTGGTARRNRFGWMGEEPPVH